jgi:hypothetical protein
VPLPVSQTGTVEGRLEANPRGHKCLFCRLSSTERRQSRTDQPLGYNGLPVLKLGRVWLNGAVTGIRAPPGAPSTRACARAWLGVGPVGGGCPPWATRGFRRSCLSEILLPTPCRLSGCGEEWDGEAGGPTWTCTPLRAAGARASTRSSSPTRSRARGRPARGAVRLLVRVSAWICELRLWPGRFEQLDWVTAGVVEQDLVASDAGDDVVSEMDSRVAQRFDGGGEVGHFE